MKTSIARTATLFTLLLLASTPAMPQERAWSLDYAALGGADFEPFELKPTPDGGVLALSRTDTAQTGDDYNIAKFSQHGTLIWARGLTYLPSRPTPEPFFTDSAAVDVDPDGNIFLLTNEGERGVVTRFTPSGDVVWETTLDIVGSFSILEYTDIDASVTGDVLVSGVRITSAPISLPFDDVVMLRSGDGSIRWRKTGTAATTRDQGILTQAKRGPGGMIVLAGQTDTFGYSFWPRVIVMEGMGGVRWHTDIPSGTSIDVGADDVEVGPTGEVTVLSSPGFGVNRRVRLTRYDAAGGLLFDSEWAPGSGQSTRGEDAVLHPSGEIWVAGSVDDEAALLRFDAAGQFIGRTAVAAATGVAGALTRVVLGEQGTTFAAGTIRDTTVPNQTLLAAFDAAGAELYSQNLAGNVPVLTDDRIGGIDAAVDARGNVFTLAQSISPASGAAELIVRKTIDGVSTGTSYCGPAVANSTGLPASLAILGQDEAARNNLSLAVSEVPVDALVLFITSRTQGLTVQAGGGVGTLCLGGSVGRFLSGDQLRRANDDGEAYLQLELTALPQPTSLAQANAGETWNFQAWFRDISAGTTTSNLSDGVSVLLR